MRFEGPIDIRPLTVRGTLGIAWQIVRRSFASLFFYALLMQLILALGLFVAFSPVLGSVIKGSFDGFDFVVEILVALMLLLLFLLVLIPNGYKVRYYCEVYLNIHRLFLHPLAESNLKLPKIRFPMNSDCSSQFFL